MAATEEGMSAHSDLSGGVTGWSPCGRWGAEVPKRTFSNSVKQAFKKKGTAMLFLCVDPSFLSMLGVLRV